MYDHSKFHVRVIRDFTDENGYWHAAGETGTAKHFASDPSTGKYLVYFDGYATEKAQDEECRRKLGEGANVVPWVTISPAELFECQESPDD